MCSLEYTVISKRSVLPPELIDYGYYEKYFLAAAFTIFTLVFHTYFIPCCAE